MTFVTRPQNKVYGMVSGIPDKSLIADAAKLFLDNYYTTSNAPPSHVRPATPAATVKSAAAAATVKPAAAVKSVS